MNALGWMAHHGQGAARNDDVALDWWRRGAAQGHALSMAALAAAYEQGWGTPLNPSLALEWLAKAAQVGDVQSAMRLAEMALKDGGRVAGFDARHWYSLAAGKGDEDAMVFLVIAPAGG